MTWKATLHKWVEGLLVRPHHHTFSFNKRGARAAQKRSLGRSIGDASPCGTVQPVHGLRWPSQPVLDVLLDWTQFLQVVKEPASIYSQLCHCKQLSAQQGSQLQKYQQIALHSLLKQREEIKSKFLSRNMEPAWKKASGPNLPEVSLSNALQFQTKFSCQMWATT